MLRLIELDINKAFIDIVHAIDDGRFGVDDWDWLNDHALHFAPDWFIEDFCDDISINKLVDCSTYVDDCNVLMLFESTFKGRGALLQDYWLGLVLSLNMSNEVRSELSLKGYDWHTLTNNANLLRGIFTSIPITKNTFMQCGDVV